MWRTLCAYIIDILHVGCTLSVVVLCRVLEWQRKPHRNAVRWIPWPSWCFTRLMLESTSGTRRRSHNTRTSVAQSRLCVFQRTLQLGTQIQELCFCICEIFSVRRTFILRSLWFCLGAIFGERSLKPSIIIDCILRIKVTLQHVQYFYVIQLRLKKVYVSHTFWNRIKEVVPPFRFIAQEKTSMKYPDMN